MSGQEFSVLFFLTHSVFYAVHAMRPKMHVKYVRLHYTKIACNAICIRHSRGTTKQIIISLLYSTVLYLASASDDGTGSHSDLA